MMAADVRPARPSQSVQDPRRPPARDPLRGRLLLPGHVPRRRPGADPDAEGAARSLAVFLLIMGLGIAFTDVLTDAMMVENGKPLGLTGAFQSVQWTAINVATLLVGLIGGYFAERRELQTGFLIAAAFPFLALMMGAVFIHEPPAKSQREEFREAWRGIKTAIRDRTMWVVAGFIFFCTFSPSIGIPLFYYQTDTLKFSQQFIGLLGS